MTPLHLLLATALTGGLIGSGLSNFQAYRDYLRDDLRLLIRHGARDDLKVGL